MTEFRHRLLTTTTTTGRQSNEEEEASTHWLEWNEQAVERARQFDLLQQQEPTQTAIGTNDDGNNDDDDGRRRISLRPFLQHLTYQDYDKVYEPSDDTYLLLDALQYDVLLVDDDQLYQEKPLEQQQHQQEEDEAMLICLEIGCGTGVVSAALQEMLLRRRRRRLRPSRRCGGVSPPSPTTASAASTPRLAVGWATDVNLHAVKSAQTLGLDTVLCDLGRAFRPGVVDILIFNPPYVPTPDDEIPSSFSGAGGSSSSGLLAAAWAGGTDGRVVIDRWVTETLTTKLAKPHGRAYLVTVDENRPDQLADYLSTTYQMTMRPLFRRRAVNEFLTVQKITWHQH
jgi:release factor glutamine methyltransferase